MFKMQKKNCDNRQGSAQTDDEPTTTTTATTSTTTTTTATSKLLPSLSRTFPVQPFDGGFQGLEPSLTRSKDSFPMKKRVPRNWLQ